SEYVPDVVNVAPPKLYVSLLQMVAARAVSKTGLTVSVRVTILSQPDAAVKVSEYVPDVVNVAPPKLYVSLLQIVAARAVSKTGLTLSVSVTILSHPNAAVKVSA